MEIKVKIEQLLQLVEMLETKIDLSTLIIHFDSYEFLMKNRGRQENRFIVRHRSNKEKMKSMHSELNTFIRQIKRMIRQFEEEDERLKKELAR